MWSSRRRTCSGCKKNNQRGCAICRENRDRRSVHEHRGRPGHPGVLDRLCGQLCAGRIGQEIQSARHDRCRHRSLSERDARRTVRDVHVLSSVSVRLPTWYLWYGPQGTQGFGTETVRLCGCWVISAHNGKSAPSQRDVQTYLFLTSRAGTP